MRGRGEGSIYRRADGYWVGQVEAGHYPNGRRRRTRVVRRRRADVLAEMDQLRRAAKSGIDTGQRRTVSAFFTWWIDEVKATTIAPTTLRNYRTIATQWVNPHIGTVRLEKLRATHVQTMVNELRRQGLAPAVVNRALKLTRQALRYAVGARLVDHNPADHVRGIPEAGGADIAMTADEAEAVLTFSSTDDLYALWWLALKYGLRIGELLELRWADVDDDELHVRRSKTAAGTRSLPLIPEAKRVLKAHQRDTRVSRVAPIEGYVFSRDDGRPIDERRIRERWHLLLDAAGVEQRRFHATRHTAATLLLEAGVPLEVVSAILGHANIAVTADIYAKVRADLKRKGLTSLHR